MRIKLKGWDGIATLLVICVPQVTGIVIAKGFWSTFFAIFVIFYAWYLTAEAMMKAYGII